jgi:hypothetical protein
MFEIAWVRKFAHVGNLNATAMATFSIIGFLYFEIKSFFICFSGVPGAGGHQSNLIDVEEGGAGGDGGAAASQSKTQMLLEEEYNVEQLQERERAIRQLEVIVFKTSDIGCISFLLRIENTQLHQTSL